MGLNRFYDVALWEFKIKELGSSVVAISLMGVCVCWEHKIDNGEYMNGKMNEILQSQLSERGNLKRPFRHRGQMP